MSQADILSQTNPNYDKGEKFEINCQRCVPAYEMRKRGYNVTAKPLPCDDDIYQYESSGPYALMTYERLFEIYNFNEHIFFSS